MTYATTFVIGVIFYVATLAVFHLLSLPTGAMSVGYWMGWFSAEIVSKYVRYLRRQRRRY
jgi:hypothetical protein